MPRRYARITTGAETLQTDHVARDLSDPQSLRSGGVGAIAASNRVLELDVTEVDVAKEDLVLLAQRARHDGEGVGNAVLRVAERKLGNRAQRRDGAMLSRWCIGLAPGANGTPALRPSGVAPVFLPYTTLEVMVRTEVVGTELR